MTSSSPSNLAPLQTTFTSHERPRPVHLSSLTPSSDSTPKSASPVARMKSQDPLLSRLTPATITKMSDLDFMPGEKEVGVWAATAAEKIDNWLQEVESWERLTFWSKKNGEGFKVPEGREQRNKRRKMEKTLEKVDADTGGGRNISAGLPVARRLFPEATAASKGAGLVVDKKTKEALSLSRIDELLSPNTTPLRVKRLDLDLSGGTPTTPSKMYSGGALSPFDKSSKRRSLQISGFPNGVPGSHPTPTPTPLKRRTFDFSPGHKTSASTSAIEYRPSTSPTKQQTDPNSFLSAGLPPTSQPSHFEPSTDSEIEPISDSEVSADEDLEDDGIEFLGSLPTAAANHISSRLVKISTALSQLDIESLKSRVLHYKSQQIDDNGNGRMSDSLAVITATTLQLLPPLHTLWHLIETWGFRVEVCKVVPTFLTNLEKIEGIVIRGDDDDADWAEEVGSAVPDEAVSDGTLRTLEKGVEDVWSKRRSDVAEMVGLCGRIIDGMLDLLDGKEETIPDDWIDRLEGIEGVMEEWIARESGKADHLKRGWRGVIRRRREEEERRRREELERRRKEEAERLRLEEERLRKLEEERIRQEEEERLRKIEDEKKRLEEERLRKAEEERLRREEEERLRKEQEERERREEAERARIAKLERQRREEAERLRLAEEERIREAEEHARLMKEEEEKRLREEEAERRRLQFEEATRKAEEERIRQEAEDAARLKLIEEENDRRKAEQARIRELEERQRLKYEELERQEAAAEEALLKAKEEARLAAIEQEELSVSAHPQSGTLDESLIDPVPDIGTLDKHSPGVGPFETEIIEREADAIVGEPGIVFPALADENMAKAEETEVAALLEVSSLESVTEGAQSAIPKSHITWPLPITQESLASRELLLNSDGDTIEILPPVSEAEEGPEEESTIPSANLPSDSYQAAEQPHLSLHAAKVPILTPVSELVEPPVASISVVEFHQEQMQAELQPHTRSSEEVIELSDRADAVVPEFVDVPELHTHLIEEGERLDTTMPGSEDAGVGSTRGDLEGSVIGIPDLDICENREPEFEIQTGYPRKIDDTILSAPTVVTQSHSIAQPIQAQSEPLRAVETERPVLLLKEVMAPGVASLNTEQSYEKAGTKDMVDKLDAIAPTTQTIHSPPTPVLEQEEEPVSPVSDLRESHAPGANSIKSVEAPRSLHLAHESEDAVHAETRPKPINPVGFVAPSKQSVAPEIDIAIPKTPTASQKSSKSVITPQREVAVSPKKTLGTRTDIPVIGVPDDYVSDVEDDDDDAATVSDDEDFRAELLKERLKNTESNPPTRMTSPKTSLPSTPVRIRTSASGPPVDVISNGRSLQTLKLTTTNQEVPKQITSSTPKTPRRVDRSDTITLSSPFLPMLNGGFAHGGQPRKDSFDQSFTSLNSLEISRHHEITSPLSPTGSVIVHRGENVDFGASFGSIFSDDTIPDTIQHDLEEDLRSARQSMVSFASTETEEVSPIKEDFDDSSLRHSFDSGSINLKLEETETQPPKRQSVGHIRKESGDNFVKPAPISSTRERQSSISSNGSAKSTNNRALSSISDRISVRPTQPVPQPVRSIRHVSSIPTIAIPRKPTAPKETATQPTVSHPRSSSISKIKDDNGLSQGHRPASSLSGFQRNASGNKTGIAVPARKTSEKAGTTTTGTLKKRPSYVGMRDITPKASAQELRSIPSRTSMRMSSLSSLRHQSSRQSLRGVPSSSAMSPTSPTYDPKIRTQSSRQSIRSATPSQFHNPISPTYDPNQSIKVVKRKNHLVSKPQIKVPEDSNASKRDNGSTSPISPIEYSSLRPGGNVPSTPAKGHELEDQLDLKINKILVGLPSLTMTPSPIKKQVPSRLNLRNLNGDGSNGPPLIPGPKFGESKLPIPRVPSTPTIGQAPNLTLSSKRTISQPGEVKMYHLKRSDDEPAVKLFVRLVGERANRVMVRVGGGWADLKEYLIEYASHHVIEGQRRMPSESVVEFGDDARSLRASNSNSSLRSSYRRSPTPSSNYSSRPNSPVPGGIKLPVPTGTSSRGVTPGRADSPFRSRRADSPAYTGPGGGSPGMRFGNGSGLQNSHLPGARGSPGPTTPGYERPGTPGSGGFPNYHSPSYGSGLSTAKYGRPTSRLSFGEGSGIERPDFQRENTGSPVLSHPPPVPLGLAGPKSRNLEISAEKKAWVDGMLGQVRKASAERNVRLGLGHMSSMGSLQGDDETGGNSVRTTPGPRLSDMGQAGSTRRMYVTKQSSAAGLQKGHRLSSNNLTPRGGPGDGGDANKGGKT